MSDQDAYAAAGVGTDAASHAISGLVGLLGAIDTGRPSRSVLPAGHYASVIAIDDARGIALCTDGVGTKLIVAEQAARFDTVGVDCVAMNVNDLICVGAEPVAMLDYIAVEKAESEVLRQVGQGLKRGAEQAGVEIPGGELAQLPEMVRGHPSPSGIDLVGAAFGTVALDAIVSGATIEPCDAVIGLPSSGIHSNGFTLARRVLLEQGGHSLDDVPAGLGRSLAQELLEPTEIYVRAVRELVESAVEVTGLAHITGDGLLNLLRLNESVGYEIHAPLPVHPIFDLIRSTGLVPDNEMYRVFNMGIGFCCIVRDAGEHAALELLRRHYPQASRMGSATGETGTVRIEPVGISGTKEGFS